MNSMIVTDLWLLQKQLEQLQHDPVAADYSEMLGQLRTLIEWMPALAAEAGEADRNRTEQIRERLTIARAQLADATRRIESLQSRCAEQYRKALGAGKEGFEAAADDEQQRINPEAAEAKRLFELCGDCTDALSELNGELLDISAAVERDSLNARRTPDIGHVGVYDGDPEPPTVQP